MRPLSIQCPACERIIRTHDQADRAVCVCDTVILRSQFVERVTSPASRPVNAWRPLHRYPIMMCDRWSAVDAENWYRDWLRTIPSVGCSCERNWRKATRESPPDFGSADAFARWAFNQHNAVRKRLNQSPWSWEDCVAAATRPVVGFVAASYMPIGGTETFHRSLLPRLREDDRLWIDGFVVSGEWDDGDMSLLGVPGCASGVPAARALAARVDVLVVWGVSELADILPTPRPRVIAVHHSDTTSPWSNDTITANRSLIDRAVCVHPDVTETLLGVPVTHIPNAVDPLRFRGNAAGLRERWGIAATDHVHFWCHRFAPEKQPDLAIEIARRLPAGHVLVMAGQAFEDVPADVPGLRYVGPIDSPGDWLATAATFLSLSTFEGFGLSLAEAIGAGVPVVATPQGIAARPGMAITLPPDAAAHEWSAALVSAVGRQTPEATRVIHTEYAIEPWMKKWADVIQPGGKSSPG